MFDTALSYEFLTKQSNTDLLEIEALCIATQDTWTLQRIQKVREWRNPSNRSKVKNPAIAKPSSVALCKEVEDVETVSPFEGLYTL